MTAPCWTHRYEAWGYEELSEACRNLVPEQQAVVDAIVAAKLALHPCRQHAPLRRGDWGCGNGYCFCEVSVLEEMCVLEAGHAGEHVYEDGSNILLAFPAVPEVPEAQA